jgi:hypothetical protein
LNAAIISPRQKKALLDVIMGTIAKQNTRIVYLHNLQ